MTVSWTKPPVGAARHHTTLSVDIEAGGANVVATPAGPLTNLELYVDQASFFGSDPGVGIGRFEMVGLPFEIQGFGTTESITPQIFSPFGVTVSGDTSGAIGPTVSATLACVSLDGTQGWFGTWVQNLPIGALITYSVDFSLPPLTFTQTGTQINFTTASPPGPFFTCLASTPARMVALGCIAAFSIQ